MQLVLAVCTLAKVHHILGVCRPFVVKNLFFLFINNLFRSEDIRAQVREFVDDNKSSRFVFYAHVLCERLPHFEVHFHSGSIPNTWRSLADSRLVTARFGRALKY